MTPGDIHYAAIDISAAVQQQLRAGRLARVDIDSIRCAVAGFLAQALYRPDPQQREDLENLTLRKFVEGCA